MASLILRSAEAKRIRHPPNDFWGAEKKSTDDVKTDDDSPEVDGLDLRFEDIATETLHDFPELQRRDLFEVFLGTSRNKHLRAQPSTNENLPNILYAITILVVSVILAIFAIQPAINHVLGIRCFIPNNYLVWEATRPISDCSYCRNVRRPLILPNMTQSEFLVGFLI